MDFLMPNNILDTLYCDVCFKFLSVTPVKVFPYKKIKCGRCILEDDDGGAVSRYNFIAERSVFKCINRFDGCRELLTTSEVLDHEKRCQSKQYECPICLENVYTYLLIKHFQINHKHHYLEVPTFSVLELNEIKQYFLYRYEENMWFITFGVCSVLSTFIYLNCLLIGDSQKDNNFKVTFKVLFGNIYTKRQIKCGTVSKPLDSFTMVLKGKRENVLVVTFTFDVKKSDNLIVKLPNVPSSNKSSKEVNEKSIEEIMKTAFIYLYFRERDIILTTQFTEAFPDASITKGSTIKFLLDGEETYVTLCCFYCSNVGYSKLLKGVDSLTFINKNSRYYSVCYYCEKAWYNNNCVLVSITQFKHILYYCKWKCGEAVNLKQLKNHETMCLKQFSQKCPINLCQYYFKLFEIEHHFKLKHPQSIPPLFVDNKGVIVVHLDCSKSPIKRIFVVSHVYIHATFIWEQPFWKINLNCELSDAKPRLVLLTAGKYDCNYISLIKESGTFRHRDSIRIKCYLAHTDMRECEWDFVKSVDLI